MSTVKQTENEEETVSVTRNLDNAVESLSLAIPLTTNYSATSKLRISPQSSSVTNYSYFSQFRLYYKVRLHCKAHLRHYNVFVIGQGNVIYNTSFLMLCHWIISPTLIKVLKSGLNVKI